MGNEIAKAALAQVYKVVATVRKNKELLLAFIPWYPLASDSGKMQQNIQVIAEKHGATATQVALAWLLKRSANILLIPGTRSLAHLQENMAAVQVKLTDEEFSLLSKSF